MSTAADEIDYSRAQLRRIKYGIDESGRPSHYRLRYRRRSIEGANAMRAKTDDDRRRALANAERQLERKLTAMRRLLASISLWQRRSKYYASQIGITDEERRARIDQAKARKAAQHRPARQIVTSK